MTAFLAACLLMASEVQAQTSTNCADSNAEVSACPEKYLPQLVVPTLAEKQSRINAIAAANSAAADQKAAIDKLDDLKLNVGPEDSDYVKQLQVAQTATAEKYDLYNEVIRLAVIFYKLTPPVSDFTGDSRAALGPPAKPWLPRYSEREKFENGHFRMRNDKELKAETAMNGGPAGARTWGQGEILMFSQAFTNPDVLANPDALALLIYHETSHWVDIVGKTGGFRKSDLPYISFETERDAYAREAKAAQQLGVDATRALALSAQFDAQAKEVGRRDWGWVIANRPKWIGTDRQGALAIVPAPPEAASDDEATLHQKMAELQEQVKKNREYMEHLEKEARQSRERSERERLAQEEEAARQAQLRAEIFARQQWDTISANCGYSVAFRGDDGQAINFTGENESFFFDRRYKTELNFGDIKYALMIARACYEADANTGRTTSSACADAATIMPERVWRDDFPDKFNYMFGAKERRSACINNIYNRADEITDAASFDKFMTQYKNHRAAERRASDGARGSTRPERKPPATGGKSRPPESTDNNRFWDPGCNCWTTRY